MPKFTVVKGQDAYVEYETVVEAESAKDALHLARQWNYDGEWEKNGVTDEYDHAEFFEDRTEPYVDHKQELTDTLVMLRDVGIEPTMTAEESDALFREPKEIVLRVTPEARDALLAGLRLLQLAIPAQSMPTAIFDIYINGGDHHGLSVEQIDDLCEGINHG